MDMERFQLTPKGMASAVLDNEDLSPSQRELIHFAYDHGEISVEDFVKWKEANPGLVYKSKSL